MRAIEAMSAGINELAARADVRDMPTVTMTFETVHDMHRFRRAFMEKLRPEALFTGNLAPRPSGEFEVYGITYKLVVRQP